MKKKPNVLLIMADQLRFDALGCYGNNQIHTPNIDNISLTGTTFDSHFVQNPVCSPSRAWQLLSPQHRSDEHFYASRSYPRYTLHLRWRIHSYQRWAASASSHIILKTWRTPQDRQFGFAVIHKMCSCIYVHVFTLEVL